VAGPGIAEFVPFIAQAFHPLGQNTKLVTREVRWRNEHGSNH
jgi:hypothetical protein